MSRVTSGSPAVLMAVAAAALLGLSVIQNPGIALPFSIELIVLLALTLAGLSREADPRYPKVADSTDAGDAGTPIAAGVGHSIQVFAVLLRTRCRGL